MYAVEDPIRVSIDELVGNRAAIVCFVGDYNKLTVALMTERSERIETDQRNRGLIWAITWVSVAVVILAMLVMGEIAFVLSR